MKTYFLFFAGDPKPYFDVLRAMGRIQVVTIFESLHCISFGSPYSERLVLNSLQKPGHPAILVKASREVFPEPPRKVQMEIDQLIDAADDNPGSYTLT